MPALSEQILPSETAFASRHPEALLGSLRLATGTLDSIEGVLNALTAIADADAFNASLRALLVDRLAQLITEEPLEGRHQGQPVRLGGDHAHAVAVSELALLLGTSENAAARTLNYSQSLMERHEATYEALASGDISEAHARTLVEQAATLPDAAVPGFEAQALERVRNRAGHLRTPGEFRRVARDLRERLHPESIAVRRSKARGDRGVWYEPAEDGMCTLTALLPAETGLAMYQRVDAVARAAHGAEGEHRTLPQLRADAIAHLALPHATAGSAETADAGSLDVAPATPVGSPTVAAPGVPEDFGSAIKAEIVVHIPAAVLLGASDDVAELEGYGVIDATTARQLAAAAPTWERLLTDVDGTPLSLGRTAYRPPAGLRRFIRYRDGTCIVPNCTGAAERAEIDHTIEWQDGGTTDATNLALLCRKHHALKSLALFHLRREAAERGENAPISGQLVWETFLGRTYPAGPAERDHILGPPSTAAFLSDPPSARRQPPQPPEPPAVVVRNDPPPF